MGTRNFTWNHVGRNDLEFTRQNPTVVDENGNFHTRLLMKINAGAEELVGSSLEVSLRRCIPSDLDIRNCRILANSSSMFAHLIHHRVARFLFKLSSNLLSSR